MTATKAVQLNLDPVLNSAFTELPGTAPLPPVVPVIQDGGDSFALTVVSQDAEIALNEIYSIPAFATRSKNPRQIPVAGEFFHCRTVADIIWRSRIFSDQLKTAPEERSA